MTDTPLDTLRKAAKRAAGELSVALGYVRAARDRHQADAGHKALIELNKAIHGRPSEAEPESASLADAEKDKDLLAARYHDLYREHVRVIAERDDRFERAHVETLNGCIAELEAQLAAAEREKHAWAAKVVLEYYDGTLPAKFYIEREKAAAKAKEANTDG